MEPSRRTDIAYIEVHYRDGDVETLSANGFHGHISKFVNHDAGNIKDRQEWDEVELHLAGPKRPLSRVDAES